MAKCYRLLAAKRSHLSKHTISLYYTLLNSLLLDAGAGFVLATGPWLATLVANNAHYGHVGVGMMVGQQMGMCYPLVASVVLLVYVKPYRRALVRLVGKASWGTDEDSGLGGRRPTTRVHSVIPSPFHSRSREMLELQQGRRHKSSVAF